MVEFSATREEVKIICEIAKRAVETGPLTDYVALTMDLEAVHCNGNPLKLEELSAAKDFDFFHDVVGIHQHLDRGTGELMDCFLPRYTR